MQSIPLAEAYLTLLFPFARERCCYFIAIARGGPRGGRRQPRAPSVASPSACPLRLPALPWVAALPPPHPRRPRTPVVSPSFLSAVPVERRRLRSNIRSETAIVHVVDFL
jgi:hypothetical protein